MAAHIKILPNNILHRIKTSINKYSSLIMVLLTASSFPTFSINIWIYLPNLLNLKFIFISLLKQYFGKKQNSLIFLVIHHYFYFAGHQSEDDGYMSMNGRKAKMALVALRPVPDCPEPQDSTTVVVQQTQEFPPPPEEAERIISTLLPM